MLEFILVLLCVFIISIIIIMIVVVIIIIIIIINCKSEKLSPYVTHSAKRVTKSLGRSRDKWIKYHLAVAVI